MEIKYQIHKSLGVVAITPQTIALDYSSPDFSSTHVEHDGEIKEVSSALLSGEYKTRGEAEKVLAHHNFVREMAQKLDVAPETVERVIIRLKAKGLIQEVCQ